MQLARQQLRRCSDGVIVRIGERAARRNPAAWIGVIIAAFCCGVELKPWTRMTTGRVAGAQLPVVIQPQAVTLARSHSRTSCCRSQLRAAIPLAAIGDGCSRAAASDSDSRQRCRRSTVQLGAASRRSEQSCKIRERRVARPQAATNRPNVMPRVVSRGVLDRSSRLSLACIVMLPSTSACLQFAIGVRSICCSGLG